MPSSAAGVLRIVQIDDPDAVRQQVPTGFRAPLRVVFRPYCCTYCCTTRTKALPSRAREGRFEFDFRVEHGGFEPPTPCLPGKCSPAELMPLGDYECTARGRRSAKRLAISAVQPVWWLAPRPWPVSPWKYSWNRIGSRIPDEDTGDDDAGRR